MIHSHLVLQWKRVNRWLQIYKEVIQIILCFNLNQVTTALQVMINSFPLWNITISCFQWLSRYSGNSSSITQRTFKSISSLFQFSWSKRNSKMESRNLSSLLQFIFQFISWRITLPRTWLKLKPKFSNRFIKTKKVSFTSLTTKTLRKIRSIRINREF